MKILSSLFGLIVLVFVVCFALSNQQPDTLALWPFSGVLYLPLYIVGLIPLALGFVSGGIVGWVYSFKHRRRAWRLAKENATLLTRIEDLQKTSLIPEQTLSRKKSFWRRRR